MLEEFGEQLIVIEELLDGPLSIPFCSQRWSLYGGYYVPRVQFDGIYFRIGASSCSSAAAAYRSLINLRLNETGGLAPVAIEGAYAYDASTVSLEATFTLDDPVILTSPKAFLVILEDDVYSAGRTYHHVARAAYDEYVTLQNQGDFVTVSISFPRDPAWNVDKIECVAFIQKMTGDKEVYASARLPMVADFEFAFDPPFASVPQGNGTAELEGTLVNISEQSDNLTLSLSNTFGWYAEFKVEGEENFHTTPVVVGLDPAEELQVYLRVTTDGEIRIGAGYLVVESENSERTQSTLARVFNGSPAILVVDDDYANDDEVAILEALDERSNLHDLWDVHQGHADTSPDFNDMKGYDLVLWHTGWQNQYLITEEDTQNLMEYMDQGRGLIVSSQDFLAGIDPGAFTADYLGIGGWETNVGGAAMTGVGGDPISDGMSFGLEFPMWYFDRADDLEPNAIATVTFYSENDDRTAVRADNETSRTITFAYGLNGIAEGLPEPNSLATLLDRSIDWIMAGQGQSAPDGITALGSSAIRGIEPTPFSFSQGQGSATIRLRISARASQAPVALDLWDLNGRLVRNLTRGNLPAGVSTACWDGRDAGGRPVSAGVYYLRLTTAEGTHNARTVVLR